ncbi:MAG: inositol monophosphatase [Planctomycetes bacterium]|nr:inositol monophosphatase [Planctomycetota bacterium]
MAEIDRIVAVGTAAVRRAGEIQREKFGGLLTVDAKLADDIKLEADRLCEEAILETIRAAFPTHAVLAEEGGSVEGTEFRWYIDPLDGTVNFYHGMPYFCSTLACYRQDAGGDHDPYGIGRPLVGITYAAPTDELFVGVAGQGTTLNGRAVTVREEADLADAFLLTAFGNSPENVAFTREVTLELSLRIRKTRNMGACAYDLANVAAGRASGFFQYGVNIWDIAAGRILVEAAGGMYHARRARNGRWALVASGKNIHGALLSTLEKLPE